MLATKIAKHNARMLQREVEDLNKKIFIEIKRIIYENGGVISDSTKGKSKVFTAAALPLGPALMRITKVEGGPEHILVYGIVNNREEMICTRNLDTMCNVLEFIELCM